MEYGTACTKAALEQYFKSETTTNSRVQKKGFQYRFVYKIFIKMCIRDR